MTGPELQAYLAAKRPAAAPTPRSAPAPRKAPPRTENAAQRTAAPQMPTRYASDNPEQVGTPIRTYRHCPAELAAALDKTFTEYINAHFPDAP